MDKMMNFVNWHNSLYDMIGHLTNIESKDKGVKPYIVSSENVKLDLELNCDEASKNKIIKAFGYKQNSDGTYGYEQKFNIVKGDLSLLDYQEQVKITGLNEYRPLSGFTRYSADKVSIWGKIMGLDPNFSKEEIENLVNFINESGGIIIEEIKNHCCGFNGDISKTSPLSVEELAMQNAKSIISPWQFYELEGGLPYAISLLDSDLTIEDFKAQWAKYITKIRYGLDISDEDAKNAINILKELNSPNISQDKSSIEANRENEKGEFKSIQSFSLNNQTYKDEATLRLQKIYEMVKSEFDNGKTELEILKQLAKLNLKV